MASPRFAWGIDIGNGALKAVKLARENGQLVVADFEYIEHEQVLSNAGDNRDSLVQSALANFVERHSVKGAAVAISVSGQQSFARFIKLPPVDEKKIPEIVRFEAIQQIPFPLDDVEWSYQLFREPDSPDVEVGIFAMRKELINAHIKQFTDVDLNVQVVQMNPLAVYNAMYHDGRFKGATMTIDLGAENTDLIIADGETVWLRSIPIGGNAFTEALVKAFKLNFAKAEDLKRNAATSKYARQIFQAMRPVFADLVSEIQRSIGFYASVHRESQIQRVIAVGGTFRMPTLQKYLQQNLQLDVIKLDRFAAGAPADPKLATTFNDHVLSMAGAYGLAVQAMGDAKITSSLLPRAIQRAKMWKEKTKWFAAAAACFVAAPVMAYGAMWAMHENPYALNASIRQENQNTLSTGQRLDTRWSQVEQSGQGDRQQIANVFGLAHYRSLWLDINNDIHSALPKPNLDPATASVEQLKQIPRHQRQQVLIDSIEMQYMPDMTALLSKNDQDFTSEVLRLTGNQQTRTRTGGWGAGSSFGTPAAMTPESPDGQAMAAPGETKRGLLVTVTGTTPNAQGYNLIEQTLVNHLKSITAENRGDREYYVAKAVLVQARSVEESADIRAKIMTAYQNLQALQSGDVPQQQPNVVGGPRGGFFEAPRRPGAQRPGRLPGAVNDTQVIDPHTGEPMGKDMAFRVVFAVVMDIPGETTHPQE